MGHSGLLFNDLNKSDLIEQHFVNYCLHNLDGYEEETRKSFYNFVVNSIEIDSFVRNIFTSLVFGFVIRPIYVNWC